MRILKQKFRIKLLLWSAEGRNRKIVIHQFVVPLDSCRHISKVFLKDENVKPTSVS